MSVVTKLTLADGRELTFNSYAPYMNEDIRTMLHSFNDRPSCVTYDTVNDIPIWEHWHKNGLLHREEDLPAKLWYNNTTRIVREQYWYKEGQLHRTTGPAVIKGDKKEYYLCGKKIPKLLFRIIVLFKTVDPKPSLPANIDNELHLLEDQIKKLQS